MSCENCFKGYILPGEPSGSIVDGAYLHAAPSPAPGPKRAVVLFTDIFGLDLVNCKVQADALSEKLNMDVWVPDLFDGKPPMKPEELEPLLPDRAGVQVGLMTYVRVGMYMLPRALSIYSTRPAVGEQRARAFVTKLRKEKGYTKIGTVGYCYGGTVSAFVGKSPELVDSVVIAHAGNITEEVAKAIKVPASWACAEEDLAFKPAARSAAEAVFKAREGTKEYVPYEFKDWKGCAHGFAIRPNQSLPEVMAGYHGALAQTVEWFEKTLA
ncbi:alpha/beta-hydrolase [Peniophora sp. CONT]|nr:alpha/beta-hydrolase [Peniophora sp. CONT]